MHLITGDVIVEIAQRLGGFNNCARARMQLVCRAWSVVLNVDCHAWASGKLMGLHSVMSHNHGKTIIIDRLSLGDFEYMHGLFRFTREDIAYSDMFKIACASGRIDLIRYMTRVFDLKKADLCLITNNNCFKLASSNGHVEVLRFLVSTFDITANDVNIRFGSQAFRDAALNGHVPVLCFFLETFEITLEDVRAAVDIRFFNSTLLQFILDTYDLTFNEARSLDNWALRLATCGGDGADKLLETLMTKFKYTKDDLYSLTDIGLEIDYRDQSQRLAHARIIKLLIDKSELIHSDLRENDYRLLSLFLRNGNDCSVKLIVDFFRPQLTRDDVCSNKNAMLRLLALHGNVEFVKVVVEEFNLSADNLRGSTQQHDLNHILFCAAENGHASVIKYLVETFDLAVDDACDPNNELLVAAASNGHLPVVQYFVNNFDITINSATRDGARSGIEFAVRMAAFEGHLSVVQCLLEKINPRACTDHEPVNIDVVKNTNINAKNNRIVLELSSVSNVCDERIKNIENDKQELEEMFGFYYAASRGHLSVMKYIAELLGLHKKKSLIINAHIQMLLDQGNAEVLQFVIDTFSLTLDDVRGHISSAIALAYANSDIPFLKCLLKNFKPSVKDVENIIPQLLCLTTGIRDVRFFKILVESFGVTRSVAEQLGRKEFFTAGFLGNLQFFRFLMQDLKMSVEVIGGRICDAISGAVASGSIFVLQYIFDKFMFLGKNMLASKQNRFLAVASKNGQIPAMHFMLSKFKTPSNTISRACLTVAARRGHVHVLSYFMENLHLRPSSMHVDKMVCAAAQYGHVSVIRFIMDTFQKSTLDIRKCMVSNRIFETCPVSVHNFLDFVEA